MVPGLVLERLRREVHQLEVHRRQERERVHEQEQILRRRHWRIHRNHMRHRKSCMLADMLVDSMMAGSMSALA